MGQVIAGYRQATSHYLAAIPLKSICWHLPELLALMPAAGFSSPANQSGRSPKVVAHFSATNLSSFIIELLQLHDAIKIKWNYAWILENISIRSHLMIQKNL